MICFNWNGSNEINIQRKDDQKYFSSSNESSMLSVCSLINIFQNSLGGFGFVPLTGSPTTCQKNLAIL